MLKIENKIELTKKHTARNMQQFDDVSQMFFPIRWNCTPVGMDIRVRLTGKEWAALDKIGNDALFGAYTRITVDRRHFKLAKIEGSYKRGGWLVGQFTGKY